MVSARKRTGGSAGLTFRYEGGVGIPGGSCGEAAPIADWTSCAAASMSRDRSNWRVICVFPCRSSRTSRFPAIVENCFSSGVATEAAISSGSRRHVAVTWIVGKSTLGRSLTGNSR